ncbi:endonuclease [Pseudomonas sp. sp1636]|uniref:endonuclease n=1 Tax=Pseudomonas sp. sp1636 TaxID=3036707 RepID=UPI0025A4D8F0|nr:endonuclease [Pseudomonas sp. sp1636]MDM8350820.1 endonuclease [Pseudomonas sp. sp1636]
MRTVVIALGYLAASFGLPALAGGQSQISAHEAREQLFWHDLYGAGGTTLYCAKAFASGGAGGSLSISPIYSNKQLKSALRCITDRQCRIMTPHYAYMVSDLHNLYPALSRVELARSNAQFAELDASAQNAFDDIDCDLKSSAKLLEPRDEAKGNIARAIFYMHIEYDLPIVGQARMYKQWHRMDPPDAAENARNEKIGGLQGTRNRFIDDPSLVEQLIAD